MNFGECAVTIRFDSGDEQVTYSTFDVAVGAIDKGDTIVSIIEATGWKGRNRTDRTADALAAWLEREAADLSDKFDEEDKGPAPHGCDITRGEYMRVHSEPPLFLGVNA